MRNSEQHLRLEIVQKASFKFFIGLNVFPKNLTGKSTCCGCQWQGCLGDQVLQGLEAAHGADRLGRHQPVGGERGLVRLTHPVHANQCTLSRITGKRTFTNSWFSIRSHGSLRLRSPMRRLRQVTRQMLVYLSTLSLGEITFYRTYLKLVHAPCMPL